MMTNNSESFVRNWELSNSACHDRVIKRLARRIEKAIKHKWSRARTGEVEDEMNRYRERKEIGVNLC